MRRSLLILAAACLLTGCSSSEDPAPAVIVDPPPPPPPEPTFCETLGWTERPFLTDAAFGSHRRDVAADFILPTTAGDWQFFANYSGCETYVFVPDNLTVSPLDSTPLLDSADDLQQLIQTSPPNAHYFFLSASQDDATVSAMAAGMAARIDGLLAGYAEADRLWWAARLHVVTVGAPKLDNWVRDAMTSTGRGFAIDRFQRIRGFGGLADVTRFDSALNSGGHWPWRGNLAYLAHEARYYEYESDRQDQLDAVDWTTRYLYYGEDIAGSGKTHVRIDLPDAAEMAGFDTMLVDLTHTCDPAMQELGNCDAWDAIQELRLCDVADPDDCDLELARYITTYHREGRWLADASQLLPFLRDGGNRRFRLNGARVGHFVSVRLLMSNTGKGLVPFASMPLWEGGAWNDTYHDDHPPMQIDVPAEAKKVFLQVTLSGHGQGGSNNCAEFCDHQHAFTVGGQEFRASHPDMGDQQGCLKQIDKGTVPNQNGTWWFERSSWCPGKQVDPWIWEITDQVTPGQAATISYTTNRNGIVFGGNIFLRSYVTYWR